MANNGNLKNFKKGYDERRNNNGRKKNIYNILLDKGYSTTDIKTAYGEMAFYTLAELKAVHEDESKPIIMLINAKLLYLAYKNGDYNKIKEPMDQILGRPNVTVDATVTTNIFDTEEVEKSIINLKDAARRIDEAE